MLTVGLGLTVAGLSCSSSDDSPTLSVDPEAVEESGEHTLVIAGEGWTASVVYVLPCAVPEQGDTVDPATCDTSDFTPVSPDNGAFSFTKTVEVPAGGLALGAGDTAQTEFAAVIVRLESP